MENQAIYIIKTFTPDEVKHFKNFLCSPFFNQSKKLLKLYNALIKFYPSFNSKHLTEKSLSKRISPDLVFNRITMNSLFFDLYKCAENFLLIKNLENNPVRSRDHLRDEFFKRKLYKLIDKNISSARKELEASKTINAGFYLNMFQLYTDIYNYLSITVPKSDSFTIINKFEVLDERAKHITNFFVTEMIREYESLLTLDKTYNSENNLNFISDIFKKIDFPELLKTLILHSKNPEYSNNLDAYLRLIKAFSNMDEEQYYFDYKKKFFANFNDFSISEKRFHYGRLIRYCMMKRETGDTEKSKFDIELFKLYEFILSFENFKSTISNYIPVELYRSILLHSLRLKKYKWTIEFIKKYSVFLNPNRRKNIYYYSMAEYYFRRKMFSDARHNLHKIVFDEFIYKIDYRNMMLIIHFELKEYESALHLIDSYKRFLSKDTTLSRPLKKRNKIFINIVQNLIHFKTSQKKKSVYYLEKEIEHDFVYSQWVKGKLSVIGIKN